MRHFTKWGIKYFKFIECLINRKIARESLSLSFFNRHKTTAAVGAQPDVWRKNSDLFFTAAMGKRTGSAIPLTFENAVFGTGDALLAIARSAAPLFETGYLARGLFFGDERGRNPLSRAALVRIATGCTAGRRYRFAGRRQRYCEAGKMAFAPSNKQFTTV